MTKQKRNFLTISGAGLAALLIAGCGECKRTELTEAADSRLALLDEEVPKKKKAVEVAKPEDAQAKKVDEPVAVEPEKPVVDPEVLKKAIADGKASYIVCSACHQSTGAGMPGMFPPLAKSNWVNGLSNEELTKIVLLGLKGKITVNGVEYPGTMPMAALGAAMDDQKVADVLTYIKNSWGNDGGYVSPEEVKAVRAATQGQPSPTAEELKGTEKLK